MPETLTEKKVKSFFTKKRRLDSHKGQNGVVLVIGGSENLVGAPALAAMSALASLRSGIDLCIVAAPEKVGWAINTYSPDLIVKKLPGKNFSKKHIKKILSLSKKSDAILIGPGMGKEKSTLALARGFVARNKRPIVIDADALRACVGMKFTSPTIITPHANEFLDFSGKKISGKKLGEKIALAKQVAKKHNCVVLLKGRVDVISDGKKVFLNRTGNPGMTVGGTGDILAGICTGFLALGAKPLHAACAAAFINGKIGDSLLKKMGYGFIASDIIPQIPFWVKKLVH